mmetsp:Transcript_36173/g.94085  ORF Transcript_36173/g.94085 Transcript_36173/m.94085 type:complete len:120 (+) Transcript_36173:1848-2207(+)
MTLFCKLKLTWNHVKNTWKQGIWSAVEGFFLYNYKKKHENKGKRRIKYLERTITNSKPSEELPNKLLYLSSIDGKVKGSTKQKPFPASMVLYTYTLKGTSHKQRAVFLTFFSQFSKTQN